MNLSKISILVLLIPCSVSGQVSQAVKSTPEIGITEKLDTYLPTDIRLISENSDTIFTDKLLGMPTVLSLVYFRCPGICTPLMDGLADVIKKTDLKIGKDYQVLTVSFNPNEGPELALRKKNNYVNNLGLEDVKYGWKFFTTDSVNIARLTNSTGFNYIKTGADYLHAATLIFISPDGKITRYLNGSRFLPFEFKMALIEASKGQSGPTLNKVLQYCYSYDPEGQGYVLNVTRVSGILIMFVLLVLFISLTARSLIRRNKQYSN